MTKVDESKKMNKGIRIAIIAGFIVGGLMVVYLGFSIFFMDHFFFRTTVNGMGVSCFSASGVEKKAMKSIDNYNLTLTARDGSTYTVAGKDFDLQEEWDDKIHVQVKNQNGFTWPGRIFSKNELEVNNMVSYDKEKLKGLLQEFDFMDGKNQTEAVNASISDYSKEDGYTIIPAVEGTKIDEEGLMAAVENALLGLKENVSMAEDGCYLKPEIDNDNETLLGTLDKMNKWVSTVITYQIGSDTQVLDGEISNEWIKLSPNNKLSIDENQVADYVAYLAKTYNTCYSAKKLKTTWGETVTINNSHYGWKVDNEAEAAQIIKEIKAGKPVTRDLNYSMTANSRGENDYGDSYVEINLTAQYLYLYENGKKVLESDFVSGNPSRGNATPCGAYGLTYKQKGAVLRGPGYASPVDYWMPFHGDYGMHDATWRRTFGGKIYRTNGSHGCINLPHAIAQQIFEVVDKNYPVLVYELADSSSPKTEEPQESESTERDNMEEEITDVINAIKKAVGSDPSKITLDKEKEVTAARKKYDALSKTAKSKVTNYEALKKAEAKLKELKVEEEHEKVKEEAKKQAKKQAKEVSSAIKKAVGSDPSKVKLTAEKKIVAAREKYDALSKEAKAEVTNYDSLKKAEAQIKKLKKEAEKEKEKAEKEKEKKKAEKEAAEKKAEKESAE